MSPLHLPHAVMSFFLPGLGQLFQKRFTAFFQHLLLFLLSAAVPCMMIYTIWNRTPPLPALDLSLVVLLLPAVFPLLTILFSALDAAYWQPGEPSQMRRPIRHLAVVFVWLYLLAFMVLCGARFPCGHPHMGCQSNMQNLALALLSYQAVHRAFPPAYTVDESGKPLHSWRVLILPHIEEERLYKEIRLDEPWDSEHNRQFHSRMPPCYRCYGRNYDHKFWRASKFLEECFPKLFRDDQDCHYSVVIGEQTVFPGSKGIREGQITDGPSNTILVAERMFPVCWIDPTHEITFADACQGVNASVYGIGGAHNNGCHAAFADGRIRHLPETIDPETLKAMLTR